MKNNLEGRYALVCGASKGIGKASAIALAELGCNVTLLARNAVGLNAAVKDLPNNGHQTHGILVADFSNPEKLKEVISEHVRAVPVHYSILVNNTGGPAAGLASEAKEAEFESAFQHHVICNHVLATTLIPYMKQLGEGRIINIISTSVKQPLPNLGVSNTIRAAVANWAKTLANELGQFNITVNNVLPGATSTERLKSIIENKANKTGASIEKVTEEMQHEIPMRRFAKPEEIAAAVAFLASPAAGYINGINLPVDGGRTGNL